MLEAALVVAAIALCTIALQLVRLTTVVQAHVTATTAACAQRELDQEILHACPTMFYQLEVQLGAWRAIQRRTHEYSEARKRVADIIDPHSNEESGRCDIYADMVAHAGVCRKERLSRTAEDTDASLRDAYQTAAFTVAEQNLVAVDARIEWAAGGGDDTILDVMRSYLRKLFSSHLQNYCSVSGKESKREG